MPATTRYTDKQRDRAYAAIDRAMQRLTEANGRIIDGHDATKALRAALEQVQIALEWMPGARAETSAETTATMLFEVHGVTVTDSEDREWTLSGDFSVRYEANGGVPNWGPITGRWHVLRGTTFDTGDMSRAPTWVEAAVDREYQIAMGFEVVS